jgi:hypothetical protein
MHRVRYRAKTILYVKRKNYLFVSKMMLNFAPEIEKKNGNNRRMNRAKSITYLFFEKN